LPALEAMATGLPVIATNWSGMADFLDPDDSLPLEYTLENPGGYGVYTARFWGQWAEPSYEHLRALLRWLYEHPDDGAALGRRAAARVRRDWTWAGPARQLYDDLDALAHGITPADALLG
jgi:glycosyltransferase involved in cell wall biosynthesis